MNFTLESLTASPTATRRGIDNSPSPAETARLLSLIRYVLGPLASHFYGYPVRILSGYRCPALNAAVGGSTTSQHMRGEAVDIVVAHRPNIMVAEWAHRNLPTDQIILEFPDAPGGGWVHLSHRCGGPNEPPNRGQTLTARRVNGVVQYTEGFYDDDRPSPQRG